MTIFPGDMCFVSDEDAYGKGATYLESASLFL